MKSPQQINGNERHTRRNLGLLLLSFLRLAPSEGFSVVSPVTHPALNGVHQRSSAVVVATARTHDHSHYRYSHVHAHARESSLVLFALFAKKIKKSKGGDASGGGGGDAGGGDDDNHNGGGGGGFDWYDSVADNASPDQVFWDEMERQRMQNQMVPVSGSGNGSGNGNGNSNVMDPVAAIGASSSSTGSSSSSAWAQAATSSNPSSFSSSSSSSSSTGSGLPQSPFQSPFQFQRTPPTLEEQKSAEATLQEYTLFMVSDNWLDENLVALMADDDDDDDDDDRNMEALTPEEQSELLERQLEDLEDGVGTNPFWMGGDEPWDLWQGERHAEDNYYPPPADEHQNMFQVDPNKRKFKFLCNELQVRVRLRLQVKVKVESCDDDVRMIMMMMIVVGGWLLCLAKRLGSGYE
jgi:hypothetical protein